MFIASYAFVNGQLCVPQSPCFMFYRDNWESLTLSGSLIEIETQAGRQFDFESGADGCFTINSSEVAELSIGDKLIEVNGVNVAHFSKLELNSLMDEWDTARLLILHNNNQNNDTQTEVDSYGETEVSGIH
ncbi:UNVERIFIED_CONTAM: hypothetical protein FKN15_014013 [Acipenser sinensis]